MIAQSPMDIGVASDLLGGLAAREFMSRHWQKRPLLVRQAIPGGAAPLSRAQLFRLAASDAVESRLIGRRGGRWTLRNGPLKRAQLPSPNEPGWTLLVQGVDLHVAAARTLLERFRFVPDARLDDLMISYATDGGGVGPHIDSYDVFLLQALGRRRWGIGRVRRPELVADAPLKMLAHFEPEREWLLEAGDMLYLPPGWAHDGVAEGECMTCSIGFRAPGQKQIAREILQRVLDSADLDTGGTLYRDRQQAATAQPGRIPAALRDFAHDAVARFLADPSALTLALGEVLSEPKPGVWFEPGARHPADAQWSVRLDRRSRMLYDAAHVYLNGEAFRASGRDASLMRRLADRRALGADEIARLSAAARDALEEWLASGWLHRDAADHDPGEPP
jgi:50S ribosomal protein L16 3-hydroxylase